MDESILPLQLFSLESLLCLNDFIFYLSIVDLQHCISFRYTVNHMHAYIYIYIYIIFQVLSTVPPAIKYVLAG